MVHNYPRVLIPCITFDRYATTLVTSEVRNPEHEAREVFLTVILPDTAFISRFAIEVGGQLFVAYVKEKTEAWKEYQSAVATGKTAGQCITLSQSSHLWQPSIQATSFKSSMAKTCQSQFDDTSVFFDRTCWHLGQTLESLQSVCQHGGKDVRHLLLVVRGAVAAPWRHL